MGIKDKTAGSSKNDDKIMIDKLCFLLPLTWPHMTAHCIKYRNFTKFAGVRTAWNSAEVVRFYKIYELGN